MRPSQSRMRAHLRNLARVTRGLEESLDHGSGRFTRPPIRWLRVPPYPDINTALKFERPQTPHLSAIRGSA
jgi:hypothetical protein